MRKFVQVLALTLGMASIVNASMQFPIVKCKINGSDNEFTTRGVGAAKDCSDATQKAACSQYESESKIGPSTPIGCQLYTDMNAFIEAAKQASISRANPQPPAGKKPAGPPQPEQVPVVATCKLDTPTAGRTDFVSIVANTECEPGAQKDACDRYAKAPGYGPAKPVGCQTFKTIASLKEYLKREAKTGRFPGMGGSAVLCQTRGNNPQKTKYTYAEAVANCNLATQKQVCQTAAGVADPIDCGKFFPDAPLMDYLNKQHPKQFGLECQLKVGGNAARFVAPDCSPEAQKTLCNPDGGWEIKMCALNKDQDALLKWSKAFPNPAFVTCRHSTPMGSVDVPNIPARDCSLETQQKACYMAQPIGCLMRDIEGVKAGTAGWELGQLF